jgi:ankyrin repeat protein
MARREKGRRTLAEVLKSTSDVLFPQGLGDAAVAIDSRDASGDTPLHVMAWRGDSHGTALLIEAGADVNAIGDMGEAPLHVAVRNESVGIVELLLRAGADPNIRSEFDETPLERARKGSMAMQDAFQRCAGK